MNIYLVLHPEPAIDTYTGFLIAADNAPEAKHTTYVAVNQEYGIKVGTVWVNHSRIDALRAKLLGTADSAIERGVIEYW
jgi:hypothetical protein